MTTQYIVEEILRRNIADLESELQRQRERADKAEATLKESQERHAAATARLRDQIERVTSEWERAEAELKEMREQEPVAKVTSTAEFGGGRHFNVQWLKPEAMKSGQTLYTRPIPAPAPAVPDGLFSEVLAVLNEQLIFDPPQHFVDAIPKSWDEYERRTYIMYLREAANSMGRRKIIKKARALLQSGEKP